MTSPREMTTRSQKYPQQGIRATPAKLYLKAKMLHRLHYFLLIALILLCGTTSTAQPRLVVPTGHFGPLSSIIFSPNGKYILTNSGGEEIALKLWEASSGKLLRTLNAHTEGITSAIFSKDGKYIITTGKDQAARLWDTESGALVYDIPFELSNWVQRGFISPDNKYMLLQADAVMEYHDLVSKKKVSNIFDSALLKIKEPDFSRENISSCAFHPNGKLAITSHADSTIRIWNLSTNQIIRKIREGATAYTGCTFNSNGSQFLALGQDGQIRIWETATGKLLQTLSAIPGLCIEAQFSKNGQKILGASIEGKAILWEVTTGKRIREFNGHTGMVVHAMYSPDEKNVLTVSLDGTARLWETNSGKQVRTIAKVDPTLNEGKEAVSEDKFPFLLAAISPDGKQLLTSLLNNQPELQELQSGKRLSRFSGIMSLNMNPRYSTDGNQLASVGVNSPTDLRSVAKVWDTKTGKLIHLLKGHTGFINVVVFHPEGKWIATAAEDSTARVWNIADEKELFRFPHEKGVYKASFSQDGNYLITQTFTGMARIWKLDDGSLIATIKHDSLKNDRFGIWNFTLSPKGHYLKIVYYDDYRVELRNVATGAILRSFQTAKDSTGNFTFSTDESTIFYSEKRDLKAISLQDGQERFSYGFTKKINFLTLSANGKWLAIGTADKKLILLDAVTGKSIKEISTGKIAPHFAEFTKDNRFLVFSNYDSIKTVSTTDFSLLYGFHMPDNEYISFTLERNNRLYFFCRTFESFIQIREPETGKVLAKIEDKYNSSLNYIIHPSQPQFIIDNKFSTDLYTIGNASPFLKLVPTSNEDYLLIDSAGHYDGTEKARKLLYFTCGTEIIELEQVKDRLWVPDLGERLLKGEKIQVPGLESLNICEISPMVQLSATPLQLYRYTIQPRKGGLGETQVLLNRIEIKRIPKAKLKPSGTGFELVLDPKELQALFLPGQENIVEVKSLTAANDISSRGAIVQQRSNALKQEESRPRLFAVVVGVSDYKGTELDLKYAAKDAEDFASALRNAATKLFNADTANQVFVYKVHTGTSRDIFPEKNSIRQLIQDIGKKSRPNDVLLVFFAGHGKWDQQKNQFFFLTAEASSFAATEGLATAGISMNELSDWIQPAKMKAQKRILVFDACNSGQAIKDLVKIGGNDQQYAAARNDEKAQQVKAIEKLNNRSGLFILSASASNQSAYELGRYSQGLLTYALLKAIREEPEILEENRFLNITRWFNSAERTVSTIAAQSGHQQEPQLVSTTSFNIGVVDEEVRKAIHLPDAKPVFTASNFQNSDEAADGDDLDISKGVNTELGEIATRGDKNNFLFMAGTASSDAYTLSGRYDVKGEEITVRVSLKQGRDIRQRFEIKGSTKDLRAVCREISSKGTSLLVNQ